METTGKLNITIVSNSKLDKLAVGDIFFLSTVGPTYVFLGKTLEGKYSFMRTDTKRHYARLRNSSVFLCDADGALYITNGELFDDIQSAMECAIRL